jgi:hypothetical protein
VGLFTIETVDNLIVFFIQIAFFSPAAPFLSAATAYSSEAVPLIAAGCCRCRSKITISFFPFFTRDRDKYNLYCRPILQYLQALKIRFPVS